MRRPGVVQGHVPTHQTGPPDVLPYTSTPAAPRGPGFRPESHQGPLLTGWSCVCVSIATTVASFTRWVSLSRVVGGPET